MKKFMVCPRCHHKVVMFAVDENVWMGDCHNCKLGLEFTVPDNHITTSETPGELVIAQPMLEMPHAE